VGVPHQFSAVAALLLGEPQIVLELLKLLKLPQLLGIQLRRGLGRPSPFDRCLLVWLLGLFARSLLHHCPMMPAC